MTSDGWIAGRKRKRLRDLMRQALGKTRKALVLLGCAVLVAGCDNQPRSFFPGDDAIGVGVGAVTHYGTGIEVARVSIDNFRAGLYRGWGQATRASAAYFCRA